MTRLLQDSYLVTLNNQLMTLETQAESQRVMLQSLTGPNGRLSELRAKVESADAEVQRLKTEEAEEKRQRMLELSRLNKEKDILRAQAMEDISKMRVEREELAAKVEKENLRFRSERDELEAAKEKLQDQVSLALIPEKVWELI